MNIEKNKSFLLKIPNFEEDCVGMINLKDNKDFLLVTLNNKRIFKICLNEKNESECYEQNIPLTVTRKNIIIDSLNTLKPNYCHSNFNYDLFFSDFEPLKIKRNEIQYSLRVEEEKDYLTNNDWIAKTIEFENICLHVEYLVFIYRSENQIFYCVIHNYKKIAKYVFFINDDYLYLIREERYNSYENLNFLELKSHFHHLTTTSYEMQKDIHCKDKRDLISMNSYKRIFSIID